MLLKIRAQQGFTNSRTGFSGTLISLFPTTVDVTALYVLVRELAFVLLFPGGVRVFLNFISKLQDT